MSKIQFLPASLPKALHINYTLFARRDWFEIPFVIPGEDRPINQAIFCFILLRVAGLFIGKNFFRIALRRVLKC